jgi:hypothetical protein
MAPNVASVMAMGIMTRRDVFAISLAFHSCKIRHGWAI